MCEAMGIVVGFVFAIAGPALYLAQKLYLGFFQEKRIWIGLYSNLKSTTTAMEWNDRKGSFFLKKICYYLTYPSPKTNGHFSKLKNNIPTKPFHY